MTAVQLMGGLGVAGILGAVRTCRAASTKRVREQIGEMTGAIETVVGRAGAKD